MLTYLFNYIYNDCKQLLSLSWIEKRNTEDNNDLGKGNRAHCINYNIWFFPSFQENVWRHGTANLAPSHRPYTRMSWVCSVTQAIKICADVAMLYGYVTWEGMPTSYWTKLKTANNNRGEPLLVAAKRGGRQFSVKHLYVWLTFWQEEAR